MTRAAALVALLLCVGGCSPTEGGPIRAAFGGDVPAVTACMPLGTDLQMTGQVGLLALDPGSLDDAVTVDGVAHTGVSDGVDIDVIALVEPNDDGEYAPLSSFFDGEPADADELAAWSIVDLPGEVSTDGAGVLLAAIVSAGADVPAEPFTIEVDSLGYRVGAARYVLPLDHRLDVVPFAPFDVPDAIDCGEQ